MSDLATILAFFAEKAPAMSEPEVRRQIREEVAIVIRAVRNHGSAPVVADILRDYRVLHTASIGRERGR